MDLNYSPRICPQTTEFSFNPPLVLRHTVIYWTWSPGRNSVVAEKQQNQGPEAELGAVQLFFTHPWGGRGSQSRDFTLL